MLEPGFRQILLASILLHVALATLPDTMGDLLQYRLWTRSLVREGLAAAYWPSPGGGALGAPTPVDYPPLVPYLFRAVGTALEAVVPGALDRPRLTDFALRLPLCAASVLLAWLVGGEARRVAPAAAALALGLLSLNPAILFDTAYWGQADAPCALLVAAALGAAVRGHPEWSWASMAAAALVKPLAYPFAPLLLLFSWKRFGPGRTLRGLSAAVLVAAAALLPFAWVGRLGDALRTLFTQIDAMPYASVNAHNAWWLATRGAPWSLAAEPVLGPLSSTAVGLLAFAALYAATALGLWRSVEARALYVAAASLAFGFFVLSTHMHENHLFLALPLMALAGIGSRPARTVFFVLSATLLANMLLHDPYLTHLARPFTPGPRLLLPPRPEPLHPLAERYAALGYPWIGEELRGETSLAGVAATLLNAQVNVLAFVAWLALAYRKPGFDGVVAGSEEWPRMRLALPLAALFVVASGVPFLARASRVSTPGPASATLTGEASP